MRYVYWRNHPVSNGGLEENRGSSADPQRRRKHRSNSRHERERKLFCNRRSVKRRRRTKIGQQFKDWIVCYPCVAIYEGNSRNALLPHVPETRQPVSLGRNELKKFRGDAESAPTIATKCELIVRACD